MCLFLETLTSIIRTGSLTMVELVDLVNSYNFCISNNLTQMVNFPTRTPDCDSHSPALLNLFHLMLVFGLHFNVHYKDWVTYPAGTDRPGELCYNFPISNALTQVVNFPTWIPDCDSNDFGFVSSDASICSTIAFPPLGNSDHDVVSVSISNTLKMECPVSLHSL